MTMAQMPILLMHSRHETTPLAACLPGAVKRRLCSKHAAVMTEQLSAGWVLVNSSSDQAAQHRGTLGRPSIEINLQMCIMRSHRAAEPTFLWAARSTACRRIRGSGVWHLGLQARSQSPPVRGQLAGQLVGGQRQVHRRHRRGGRPDAGLEPRPPPLALRFRPLHCGARSCSACSPCAAAAGPGARLRCGCRDGCRGSSGGSGSTAAAAAAAAVTCIAASQLGRCCGGCCAAARQARPPPRGRSLRLGCCCCHHHVRITSGPARSSCPGFALTAKWLSTACTGITAGCSGCLRQGDCQQGWRIAAELSMLRCQKRCAAS